MNIEQQINLLKCLGYTVEDYKTGLNEVGSCTKRVVAFKGERPENLKSARYDFHIVAKKEAENLMYEIMMDKIAEETKYLK